MVVRQTVMVCVLAVLAYLGVWWAFSGNDEPAQSAPEAMFLTDYSKAEKGNCVRFSGPGENDQGLTVVNCDRAALKIGSVLSETSGRCPRGDYKVLRDTRHNAALCLLPNAAKGDCFEFDTDDLQRSVVSKFDCAAPRVNVQVVDVAGESCPEEAELGVPYEDMTLCLRRVR
ncbi:LppU/SCO3897 family protein [Lentzea sp. HUAS TT2]|uniref:LppU/SCO3897 family protein n=1 Tax=Lentzea sp. HUAS TT2 TaxID=3447454 RepID=UPI003F700A13